MVRARLDASPRRKATSRSVSLFRDQFQVIDMIVTKSELFVSGMLRVRSLVLMNVQSRVRRYDHVCLKHLSMNIGLRQRCNSGLPRSMHRASMLQSKARFRCIQMSASML